MRRFYLLAGLVLAGLANFSQPLQAQQWSGQRIITTRYLQDGDKEAKDAPDAAPMAPMAAEGGSCSFPGCVEPQCRTFGVFADWLWLTARGDALPFAQIRDGDFRDTQVPRGPVGMVDSDYSSGFRLGAWTAASDTDSISASVSWWDNGTTRGLSVDQNQLFNPVITALLLHPNTINTAADSLEAEAHARIRFYTADIDLKHTLCAGDCYNASLLLGARYVHIDQDVEAAYSLLGGTLVNSHINMDAAGPKVGLEGTYNLKHRTFVYARSNMNLLFGHFGANYLQQNVFAGEQAKTQYGDDRWVPNFEFELGLGWKDCSGRFSVTAGYTAAAYFNTMTQASWIEGVQSGQFNTNADNLRDTLTFDGLFTRFEFKF